MRPPVRSGTGRPAALKAASITVPGSAANLTAIGTIIVLSSQWFREAGHEEDSAGSAAMRSLPAASVHFVYGQQLYQVPRTVRSEP